MGTPSLDRLSFAAIYCTDVYWVTHDSGICPFWFALYKLHNFFVSMSFVYAIGVCNKMAYVGLWMCACLADGALFLVTVLLKDMHMRLVVVDKLFIALDDLIQYITVRRVLTSLLSHLLKYCI